MNINPDYNQNIKILLVDDHMVVRKGLIHVLNNAPDLEVIAEAESGEEALHLNQKHRPDVIVMDVQMDGLGGIETTRLLVKYSPEVKVVGLSTFADPETVGEMISAGASGYLLKDVSASELAIAIRKIYNGEKVISPALENAALSKSDINSDEDIGTAISKMSDQQKRVMALLTKGFTNPEIATFLGVSQPTARYHVSAILQKLDVSNRSEAVALIIRKKLISDADF